VVVAVAELVLGVGSDAVDPTDAVLLIVVPAATPDATCTTTVMLADAPSASEPRLHATGVAPTHDPCVAIAETNDVPAGSGSLTVTLDASDGPLLVTPIVYVRFVPAVTGSGESDLATARSAEAATVVVDVAELFAAVGSAVVELTEAVLLMTVPSATEGPTCTTRVIVGDAPFAIDPSAQETVVVPAQEPCDGVAETKVVPVGRVSFTVTF
jgi:hypothetical protein